MLMTCHWVLQEHIESIKAITSLHAQGAATCIRATCRACQFYSNSHHSSGRTLIAVAQPTLSHNEYIPCLSMAAGATCPTQNLDEEQALPQGSRSTHVLDSAKVGLQMQHPPAASATTSPMVTSRQPSSTPARAWFSCPCTRISSRYQQGVWLLDKVMLTGCHPQPRRGGRVYRRIRLKRHGVCVQSAKQWHCHHCLPVSTLQPACCAACHPAPSDLESCSAKHSNFKQKLAIHQQAP